MFKEGKLLKFVPFSFKNGSPAKPKFFVVLKKIEDAIVLASLPTSVDHIPNNMAVNYGCINNPENCMSAFVFSPGLAITDTFSFPLRTYIYGEQVDEYQLSYLSEMDSNILDLGLVRSEIMKDLIDCLKQSPTIKRKYKRLL